MNQNSNYCKYCERQFHSKCAKDVHEPTCEFFFRTKREKDAEDDYIEKLIEYPTSRFSKYSRSILFTK